ncbi:UNVERIFIED_CONTAM: hypothetical protein NY603_24295, partial [Bacteroidetes bacterium 56_B9]
LFSANDMIELSTLYHHSGFPDEQYGSKAGVSSSFYEHPKIFHFVVPLKAFEWTMSVTNPNVPGRKFFSLPFRTNVCLLGGALKWERELQMAG